MENWQAGDECYHKATNKKCVVIKINEDGTIKVRTSDDQEKDYHSVELRRPQSAIVNHSRSQNHDPFDIY